MDVLFNYKFSKPFVSQTELVELFGSLSESTLKRYMKEWIDSGNDVKDMGMFRLDKVRENQWEPVTFMKWLYENKINKAYKYDYEIKQQEAHKEDFLQHINVRRINDKANN